MVFGQSLRPFLRQYHLVCICQYVLTCRISGIAGYDFNLMFFISSQEDTQLFFKGNLQKCLSKKFGKKFGAGSQCQEY